MARMRFNLILPQFKWLVTPPFNRYATVQINEDRGQQLPLRQGIPKGQLSHRSSFCYASSIIGKEEAMFTGDVSRFK